MAPIVEVVDEGLVDDVLAEVDQLAAQEQVVDRVAVVLGIDDGDDGGQPRQILRAADLGQRAILVEQVLQGDRVGDLAALDQLADGLVDAPVDGIGEMLGPQELVDLVEGQVVGEDRAEQRHLGLVVVGGGTVGGAYLATALDETAVDVCARIPSALFRREKSSHVS